VTLSDRKIISLMTNRLEKWQEYKQRLEKRAIEHPVQWVLAAICFAFFTGVNTICALFGRSFLGRFSPILGIYAVGTSVIFTALFASALIGVLRQLGSAGSADEPKIIQKR
jgi:hypothetical protein